MPQNRKSNDSSAIKIKIPKKISHTSHLSIDSPPKILAKISPQNSRPNNPIDFAADSMQISPKSIKNGGEGGNRTTKQKH